MEEGILSEGETDATFCSVLEKRKIQTYPKRSNCKISRGYLTCPLSSVKLPQIIHMRLTDIENLLKDHKCRRIKLSTSQMEAVLFELEETKRNNKRLGKKYITNIDVNCDYLKSVLHTTDESGKNNVMCSDSNLYPSVEQNGNDKTLLVATSLSQDARQRCNASPNILQDINYDFYPSQLPPYQKVPETVEKPDYGNSQLLENKSGDECFSQNYPENPTVKLTENECNTFSVPGTCSIERNESNILYASVPEVNSEPYNIALKERVSEYKWRLNENYSTRERKEDINLRKKRENTKLLKYNYALNLRSPHKDKANYKKVNANKENLTYVLNNKNESIVKVAREDIKQTSKERKSRITPLLRTFPSQQWGSQTTKFLPLGKNCESEHNKVLVEAEKVLWESKHLIRSISDNTPEPKTSYLNESPLNIRFNAHNERNYFKLQHSSKIIDEDSRIAKYILTEQNVTHIAAILKINNDYLKQIIENVTSKETAGSNNQDYARNLRQNPIEERYSSSQIHNQRQLYNIDQHFFTKFSTLNKKNK